MAVSAIVTLPPYASYMDEIMSHPIVSAMRLNTVMPVADPLEDMLNKLRDKADGKSLWIDLKCRQLRIADYGVPPFTEITLTHDIEVDCPATAYFSDGLERATVLAVDGNRLIMQDGPKRVVGPGEGVNIPSSSLKVDGYLTDMDKRYIEAATNIGLHDYMLSFVEHDGDIGALKRYDPSAEVIAKIESRQGMAYLDSRKEKTRLMAARGDLYIELDRPHHLIRALEKIINFDKDAVAASRIFPSLVDSYEPACQDILDVDNLLRMGYETLMFGDQICMKKDSLISGLNLLEALSNNYR